MSLSNNKRPVAVTLNLVFKSDHDQTEFLGVVGFAADFERSRISAHLLTSRRYRAHVVLSLCSPDNPSEFSKSNSLIIEKYSDIAIVAYRQLAFLTDLEKSVDSISLINDNTNNDKKADNGISEPVEINNNSLFLTPKSKKLKSSSIVTQQNELLSLACDYLAKDNNQGSDLDISKVWASKLKTLDPNQKLFSEKAINDILFEVQLGTFNRNSVHINPQSTTGNYIPSLTESTHFSRSTTPLTWTDHSTSTSAENVIPLSKNVSTYFTSFNEQAYQQ
ncbi:hypothetical protein QTP88_022404 [Uroleucon formosanum]